MTGVGTTVQPPFCTGDCSWIWSSLDGIWVQTAGECVTNLTPFDCTCPTPTGTGDACGDFRRTFCRFSTTTTTPAITPTTQCGDPPLPTTTTTTPDPNTCTGFCRWQWDSALSSWIIIDQEGCSFTNCTCTEPVAVGDFDCEIRETFCGTTTTTTSTTTTPPPTTTTCRIGDCGVEEAGCFWECISGGWQLVNDFCCKEGFGEAPAVCVAPCPTVCAHGDTQTTECVFGERCHYEISGGDWVLRDEQCPCDEDCDESQLPTPVGQPEGADACINCGITTTTTSTTSTTTTPPPYWCEGDTEAVTFCPTLPVCTQTPNFACILDGPFATFALCEASAACSPTTTTPQTCACSEAGLVSCGFSSCVYECVAGVFVLQPSSCGVVDPAGTCIIDPFCTATEFQPGVCFDFDIIGTDCCCPP